MISYKAHLKVTIILAGKEEVNSLDGDDFVFGRSVKSNVYIKDPSLSRSHFKIFINQQTLWLTDLGSSNSTYINNIKMNQNASERIDFGDIISIDNTDTKIIIDEFDIYQSSFQQQKNNSQFEPHSTLADSEVSLPPQSNDSVEQHDLTSIMNKIFEDAQSKAEYIIAQAQKNADEKNLKTITECNVMINEAQEQADILRETAYNEAINDFTLNEKGKIIEELEREKERLTIIQQLEGQEINEKHLLEKAELLKTLEIHEEKIEQLKYEFKKLDKEVSLKREKLLGEINLEYTNKQQELRRSYEEAEAANELRKKEINAISEKEFLKFKNENEKEKNELLSITSDIEKKYLTKKNELNKIEKEVETIIEKRLEDMEVEFQEHRTILKKTMEELETTALLRKKEINGQLAEETKKMKEELLKSKEEKKVETLNALKEFQKEQDENKNNILISFREFKKEEEEKKNDFLSALEEFKESQAIKRKEIILSDGENEKKRQKLLVEKDLEYKNKQQTIIKNFEAFEASIELTKTEHIKKDQELIIKSKQRQQAHEAELAAKQHTLQKIYNELESAISFKKNEFEKMDQVHQSNFDSKIQIMTLNTENKKIELQKEIDRNEDKIQHLKNETDKLFKHYELNKNEQLKATQESNDLNEKLQTDIQHLQNIKIKLEEEKERIFKTNKESFLKITDELNILKKQFDNQELENKNLISKKELQENLLTECQQKTKSEEIKLEEIKEEQITLNEVLKNLSLQKELILPQFQTLNNQLSELSKKIEITTSQNNRLQSDHDKNMTDLEKKHIEAKSKYSDEMRLLTIKEEKRLQELLRVEMTRIGKIKEESLRLVIDLEDSITKEISNASSKIFAETIGIDRYREIVPLFEKTLRTSLQSGILKLLHNQLEPNKDNKKKTLSSTKKNWKPFSVGVGASAIAFLLLPYIYKEIQIQNDPIQQNLRAEARAREFAPIPIAKFIPQKVKDLGSNFTNSVIYTENFCETYAIEKFRSELIKEGMVYLYKNWQIPEEKSIESYSLMFSMIDTLKEKRENINPEFEKKDIAKMEALEQETMKKVENLFGNAVRLEAALKFQTRFYKTFTENTNKTIVTK